MKFLRSFVSAFLGGIAISLGCAAYCLFYGTSPILASFMFAIGFLAVVIFKFDLFTDKMGHLFDKGRTEKNIKTLFTTLFGNLGGAILGGTLLLSKVYDLANPILSDKVLRTDTLALIASSFVCGILIYIGLHGFRKAGSGFTGCLVLVGATMLIGLCGFDYALFNAFLTGAGIRIIGNYSSYAVQLLVLWIGSAIGNAAGAVAFAYLCKFSNKEDSDSDSHKHKS